MGKPGQFVRPTKAGKKPTNKSKSVKTNKVAKRQASELTNSVKPIAKKLNKKNLKKQLKGKLAETIQPAKTRAKPVQNSDNGENFHDKLANSLKASRFRFINEELYTSRSDSATSIITEDPEAFKTYHEGYRQQVAQWPMNPLDRIIKSVKAL